MIKGKPWVPASPLPPTPVADRAPRNGPISAMPRAHRFLYSYTPDRELRDGGVGGTKMKEDGEALWMVMDCLWAQLPPRLILLALCLAPRSQGLIRRGAAPRLQYSNPPGGASGPITARSEVISAGEEARRRTKEERVAGIQSVAGEEKLWC